MKRYAIFDFDGTLVDSMGYWRRLGLEYLSARGVEGPVTPVLEQVKSMTVTESAALFLRAFHLPGSAAQIAAEMNEIMELHYQKDVSLKPGAQTFLSDLRRADVQMCVASATDRGMVEMCLHRLNIDENFAFVLSCEEVNAGKDRPEVFLEAARRFDASPREIAVYEDSLQAAATAKTAGFYTVAVFDETGRPEWNRLSALADEVIIDWSKASPN